VALQSIIFDTEIDRVIACCIVDVDDFDDCNDKTHSSVPFENMLNNMDESN
jgi:hypothetical protein